MTTVYFAENGFFLSRKIMKNFTPEEAEEAVGQIAHGFGMAAPPGIAQGLFGPHGTNPPQRRLRQPVTETRVILKDRDLLDALRETLEKQAEGPEFLAPGPQLPSIAPGNPGPGDCKKKVTINRHSDGFSVRVSNPPDVKLASELYEDEDWKRWGGLVKTVTSLAGQIGRGSTSVYAFNTVDEVVNFVEQEITSWGMRNGLP